MSEPALESSQPPIQCELETSEGKAVAVVKQNIKFHLVKRLIVSGFVPTILNTSIWLYAYLFIYLFIYLCIYLFMYLFMYLFIYLFSGRNRAL